MDSKNVARQIKIKTGSLNRSVKDYKYYEKEVATQTGKVEELKKTCDDEGKVRQNEENLAESIAMLPNCKAKIAPAREDLHAVMEQVDEANEFRETEDYKKAVLAIEEADAFLLTI
jgi:tubulin-specific chaperone A